MKRSWNSWA